MPESKKKAQLILEIEKLEKALNQEFTIQESAFDWQLEFPELCNDDGDFVGFEVVLGNPPYIKEYESRKVFDGLRELSVYQGKMDLWYLFGAKGIELISENSFLSYIAPNNWTTNAGASKFRNYILQNSKIIQIIDFGSYFVFEQGDIQTMVLLLQNNKLSDNYTFHYCKINSKDPTLEIVQKAISKENSMGINYLIPTIKKEQLFNNTFHFTNNEVDVILNKIKSSSNFSFHEKSNAKQKIISEIGQGIVTPQDNVNKTSYQKLNEVANGIHSHHDKVTTAMLSKLGTDFKVGNGIFVLSETEKYKIQFIKDELKLIVPQYTSKELRRYYANPKNRFWLIYTDSAFKKQAEMLKYPNIKAHLDKYSSVITSDNRPYGLHRSREPHLFTGEKILSLRKCKRPTFSYCNFDCYVLAEFYVIKSKRINLKYLTGILNSKLIEFWLLNRGKMQGNIFQVDKEPIMNLPIINTTNKYTEQIIKNVDKILQLKAKNQDTDISDIELLIDILTYKIYGLNYSEILVIDRGLLISQKEYESI